MFLRVAVLKCVGGASLNFELRSSLAQSYHHQLADVQAMDPYSPRTLATDDPSLFAMLPRAAVLKSAGGTSLNMELQ